MKNERGYFFTTPAFQKEELRLMLQEANKVAAELKLPEEQLPIKATGLKRAFFVPYEMVRQDRMVGNIDTEQYSYNFARDNKFSELDNANMEKFFQEHQANSILPLLQMDTNMAYQMATQWLSAISVDVKALSRDFTLRISVPNAYYQAPQGMFVPFYNVAWCKKWKPQKGVDYSQTVDMSEWESVVYIQFYAPTKTIMQLSVKDSKYILRKPLVITNLNFLLSQTNVVESSNVPSKQ